MVLAVLARARDNCCRKFVIGLLANSKEQLDPKGGVFISGYPNTGGTKRPGWNEGCSFSWGRQAGSKLQEHSWLVAWFSFPLFNFLFILHNSHNSPSHPFSCSASPSLYLPTPIHSSNRVSPPMGNLPSLPSPLHQS